MKAPLTDDEGDQSRLDILFDCFPDGLTPQSITIRFFHLERSEGDAQQQGRLASVA
jgi:hypothetical protein